MMNEDLSRRIEREELMDDPLVSPDKFKRALKELNIINKYLGGWQTSISGIERLLPAPPADVTLLDAGTGGGDVAAELHRHLIEQGFTPTVVGVDRSPDAISYARSTYGSTDGLRFRQCDVHDLQEESWDIVHASLFLHHIPGDDIPSMLRKFHHLSERGVVINDLHRHPAALRSIQLLTTLLSSSKLVRHDAPLSVRRAFTQQELESFAEQAGLPAPRIRWRWAFRWLLTVPAKDA